MAQALLGFMYENGLGVPQDFVPAADLYERAAEQGNAQAQALLGLMYDKGHGVKLDVILAYKWLDIAAGHAPPRDRDYYARLRDAIASKMSPGDLAKARALAFVWTPRLDPGRAVR